MAFTAEASDLQETKRVIFETDMCFDVDDVGALATLHVLANKNEVEILLVSFNEVHESGAAAIQAINEWYGRGHLPIGVYRGELKRPDDSAYLDAVARMRSVKPINVSDSRDLYASILREQPDRSVTIVSVGFLNNLAELLRSHKDLIASKVDELVVMGGLVNDNFNLIRHELASETQFVLEDWPTQLTVTDFGVEVQTGSSLESSPTSNPVREAYFRYFRESFRSRASWDQVAVLYAVRGADAGFELRTTGEGRLRNGYRWSLDRESRRYIRPTRPVEEYRELIEQLMTAPPIAN